jgi:hypothetical protein
MGAPTPRAPDDEPERRFSGLRNRGFRSEWAATASPFMNNPDQPACVSAGLSTAAPSCASHRVADTVAAMKRQLLLSLASILVSVLVAGNAKSEDEPPNTLSAAERAAGWRLLFDGTTLNGWRGYKKPDATGLRWRVADGCVGVGRADGSDTRGQRDMVSTDMFDQFDLRFEWKVQPGSNSGLKYFVTEKREAAIGHEYQIIDDERHADAKVRDRQTASFYDVKAATSHPTRPIGEWNSSRVLVQGNHVEHWLNGVKVLEYELGSPELAAAVVDSKFKGMVGFGTRVKGHILLQDHGDAVCYRSLKIKAL